MCFDSSADALFRYVEDARREVGAEVVVAALACAGFRLTVEGNTSDGPSPLPPLLLTRAKRCGAMGGGGGGALTLVAFAPPEGFADGSDSSSRARRDAAPPYPLLFTLAMRVAMRVALSTAEERRGAGSTDDDMLPRRLDVDDRRCCVDAVRSVVNTNHARMNERSTRV